MAPYSTYRKEKFLGKGFYGKVYLAVNPYGRKMAFKEISLLHKSERNVQKAVTEAKLIVKFNNPFIIKSFGNFIRDGTLTIVMEYAEYGNLYNHVKKFHNFYNEVRILDCFAQLVIGLSYLHDRGIVHRDISALNVLVMDNWRMKIADFGIAKNHDDLFDDPRFYFRGNYSYMAPEIVSKERKQNFMTDVWALGVILYYMAAATFPYYGDSLEMVYDCIVYNGRDEFPSGIPTVDDLIDYILEIDPRDRPTCRDLMSCYLLEDHVYDIFERFDYEN